MDFLLQKLGLESSAQHFEKLHEGVSQKTNRQVLLKIQATFLMGNQRMPMLDKKEMGRWKR